MSEGFRRTAFKRRDEASEAAPDKDPTRCGAYPFRVTGRLKTPITMEFEAD